MLWAYGDYKSLNLSVRWSTLAAEYDIYTIHILTSKVVPALEGLTL